MSNSIVAQISKNLLFRYRLNCKKFDSKPTSKFDLPIEYQLPFFGAFDGQNEFAEIRVGWSEDGLFVAAEISKKEQSLWCKETQLLDSDGLQLWIDTRNTNNVHRASKFCHWFALLPTGGGGRNEKPIASMLKINRSKDDSPTINRHKPDITTKVTKNGYKMTAFVAAKCLNGWDTADHRHLGFNYVVIDRELGQQTLALGPELPITEDPTLWQSLHLVD